MSDITLLILILLVIRIALDLMALSTGGISYRFEFAYFVLFLVAAMIMLADDPKDLWGAIAAIISLYSLVQFFVKKARHRRNESNTAT